MRNVSLELNRGKHLRLIISKFGKISPYPDNIESTPKPPLLINRENNISMIEMDAKILMRQFTSKERSYDCEDSIQSGRKDRKEYPSLDSQGPFVNGYEPAVLQPYLVMHNFNPPTHNIYDSPYTMISDPNGKR